MVELFDCSKTSLRQGAKGSQVTLLQTHLKTLGYYTSAYGKTLKLDGDYGPYTKAAVTAFQKATGNVQDGYFGPITCKSLNEKINAKNTAVTTLTATGAFDCPKTNLQEGMTGDAVKKLQEELKKLGYYTRQVDGDFGPWTKKAVQAFQTAKGGLLVDGIFGPVTCSKLQSTTAAQKVEVATVKAVEPPKDPYKVDVSKNVLKAEESNLDVDGLYFMVSNITFTNPFKSKSFKRLDMMDGSQKKYQTPAAPREYSVDCILTLDEYTMLEYEFYKMLNRDCNVVTTLFPSGKYNVEISLAYQNVKSRKVTMKFTEVI